MANTNHPKLWELISFIYVEQWKVKSALIHPSLDLRKIFWPSPSTSRRCRRCRQLYSVNTSPVWDRFVMTWNVLDWEGWDTALLEGFKVSLGTFIFNQKIALFLAWVSIWEKRKLLLFFQYLVYQNQPNRDVFKITSTRLWKFFFHLQIRSEQPWTR